MHLTSFRKNGGYLVFEVKVAGYVQIRGLFWQRAGILVILGNALFLRNFADQKGGRRGKENDGGNVIGADIPSSSSIFSTLFPILPLPRKLSLEAFR